ncbi:MAG: hypothetical protein PUC06_08185 [Oscillospiraceae bacterium]|nr:hypothetical protein [Oscillospiraceae bacterium]
MANSNAAQQNSEPQKKITIGPLERDGEKLIHSLEKGNMVAILSKAEIMYTLLRGDYLCYIHPIGAEEGRAKRLPNTEECRAVVKNLSGLADQLFEVEFELGMDTMGVMQAAENAIVAFLDSIGELPAEDIDFMTGEAPKQNS